MPERIDARAPTRIDLAGGTVDLWPLYLLHEDGLTVNAAIDLHAHARVERLREPGIEFVSEDRSARSRVGSVRALARGIGQAPADLEFPMRLAAHFFGEGRPAGFEEENLACRVTTSCLAPAGSGLGGSSALGIALASALTRFVGREMAGEALLSTTRAIETQVLRIPTGEQDYHPALRGGLLALHYTVEGTRIERLPADLSALRERIVLVFTGQSRSSGISNWDMLKRHLDGDLRVRGALDRVIRATHAMRAALLSADFDAAGAALGEEWVARQELSATVTTEAIDRLIDAGRAEGAIAGKVCGAGGGGCLVLWSRAGRREAISRKMTSLGARPLDFQFIQSGVEITEA
jgi:D-glycero-alpha-D-manno-heptose-7-phosphate kinase